MVRETYDRIRHDDRHLEVKLRYFGESSERMFGKWAMLHDPAISWLWTRTEIEDGVLDQAGVAGFMQLFRVLSENVSSNGDAGC